MSPTASGLAAARIDTRSELLSALTAACELEHGLACSYLYTAFTLKQDLSEGGLTWQQLQKVRKWAAQIYFVASQEMLHLAQAWNLLAAIGGMPYYLRPNFPQGSRYYSMGVPLELERFGLDSLERFMRYELPNEAVDGQFLTPKAALPSGEELELRYATVGELYQKIAAGFSAISEESLFIGAPSRQIGEALVDFPDIVPVVDRASALEAIHRITLQGEGTSKDRVDCHFGMFKAIRDEYYNEVESCAARGEPFEPARPAMKNPVPRIRGDYGAKGVNLIREPYARGVAELFDDLYGVMLRMLAYVFSQNTGEVAVLRSFCRTAIAMMPMVLKPLGDALPLLPAGMREPEAAGYTAGPAFAMSRHVLLPSEPEVARLVAVERMGELAGTLEELARSERAPAQLVSASRNLRRLVESSMSEARQKA